MNAEQSLFLKDGYYKTEKSFSKLDFYVKDVFKYSFTWFLFTLIQCLSLIKVSIWKKHHRIKRSFEIEEWLIVKSVSFLCMTTIEAKPNCQSTKWNWCHSNRIRRSYSHSMKYLLQDYKSMNSIITFRILGLQNKKYLVQWSFNSRWSFQTLTNEEKK